MTKRGRSISIANQGAKDSNLLHRLGKGLLYWRAGSGMGRSRLNHWTFERDSLG